MTDNKNASQVAFQDDTMRFACDTGGTFTDLVVEFDSGELHLFKASTTPDDPVRGVLNALNVAAKALGIERSAMLADSDLFIHGTTRAINAIITGTAAKTALLTTRGNPDVLVFREGGRMDPFNFTIPFPKPFVPRALTYEVTERVDAEGDIVTPLDQSEVGAIATRLRADGVEAVAVCFLWSVVNPTHEKQVGEMLKHLLPDVAITLSHEVNPILREYRRASSAAMDASLKPLMHAYMTSLEDRLREAGFGGRLLVATSQAAMLDAKSIAATPIHSLNSGPAMAPVAGRYYADADAGTTMAIVADTGGTTYDVSLIRDSRIPWTNETWIGQPFRGHMTGFPSVDVKSVGAGGGSIAWVDEGGLLHVGPMSAGAVPGPVCYGRGGDRPTVTDAALVLGYLDPDNFLGGSMRLEVAAARKAVGIHVAEPLGLSIEDAAVAIIDVATENMVQAIEDITVNQGMDPSEAALIGGGGAAGFNSVLIARRLRCKSLIFPETGAALSAAGALISDLATQIRIPVRMSTSALEKAVLKSALSEMKRQAEIFITGPASAAIGHAIEFSFEGRYPSQVWDIQVTLDESDLSDAQPIALEDAFHSKHRELFAIADEGSSVEIVGLQARVACRLRASQLGRVAGAQSRKQAAASRSCYFGGIGQADTKIYALDHLPLDRSVSGPAIIESPLTSIVLNPGSLARKTQAGSVVVDFVSAGA